MDTDPATAYQPGGNYGAFNDGVDQDIFMKISNGSLNVGVVWPGPAVFPDWFHSGSQNYWTGQFQSFFSAESGVDIDYLWIDMNEVSPVSSSTGNLPNFTFSRHRTSVTIPARILLDMPKRMASHPNLRPCGTPLPSPCLVFPRISSHRPPPPNRSVKMLLDPRWVYPIENSLIRPIAFKMLLAGSLTRLLIQILSIKTDLSNTIHTTYMAQ